MADTPERPAGEPAPNEEVFESQLEAIQIKVEAFDRENQVPIKGARVVMHPYRALTDENGVASVRVTKCQYDILVSASKFLPVTTTVEVTADMITRAELDVEPPLESTDEA